MYNVCAYLKTTFVENNYAKELQIRILVFLMRFKSKRFLNVKFCQV